MRSRYLDIDDRTQDLAEVLHGEPAIAEEFHRRWEFSWIHHENALEGVVFSGSELEAALCFQPLANVAAINALRDIRNFKAAVEVVRAEAALVRHALSLPLVQKLYSTLHAGTDARAASEFRRDIPLHRAYFHDIAQPARIAPQLAELFAWTQSSDFKGTHPIQKASRLQHGFMQVYPYTEGSGKIARLLANLVFLHAGYLPCVIHSIDRQRYYEALRHPEPQLRDLVFESIENGLASGEKFVRAARAQRRRARSVA